MRGGRERVLTNIASLWADLQGIAGTQRSTRESSAQSGAVDLFGDVMAIEPTGPTTSRWTIEGPSEALQLLHENLHYRFVGPQLLTPALPSSPSLMSREI